MNAYWFRVIGVDGKPTGHVGMVVGKGVDSLFWAVDEYVDPYAVQIATCHGGGFCVRWTGDKFADDIRSEDHEISEKTPLEDEALRWRDPPWVVKAPERRP